MVESDNSPSQIGVLARMKLPKGKDRSFIRELVEGFRQYQPNAAPYNLKLAKRSLTQPNYAWEETKSIDIDYHLRHSALPQPGGERELAVLISRLHSIPLDHSRPMWECHVIEGLEDDCFAIYSKMHHSLIDGVAGTRLLSNWLQQLSPKIEENFPPFWAMPKPKGKLRTKEAANEAQKMQQTLLSQLSYPVKAASGVVSATFKSILGGLSGRYPGLVAPYTAPRCVLNDAIGPQRRVSTVELDLAALKAVSAKMDSTLNDVALSICGGALRRYLLEQNELPKSSLVTQVPVSFRQKGDTKGGNAIGMVLASLGTNEENPLKRFERVAESMSGAKELLSNMDATQITAYSALMTLPFTLGQMSGFGNRRSRPMYNVVISNIAGPKETRYLNGAEVFSMHPISFVMQGQALNITLFTYDEKMTFVFTACRDTVPGVQRLVEHTKEALQELNDAIENQK